MHYTVCRCVSPLDFYTSGSVYVHFSEVFRYTAVRCGLVLVVVEWLEVFKGGIL